MKREDGQKATLVGWIYLSVVLFFRLNCGGKKFGRGVQCFTGEVVVRVFFFFYALRLFGIVDLKRGRISIQGSGG